MTCRLGPKRRDYNGVAANLRRHHDRAHARALVSTEPVDEVFEVQDLALALADCYGRENPAFDRQRFLTAALDQPGIGFAWKEGS